MPFSASAIFSLGFLTTNLSKVANRAGSKIKIIKVAQKVPNEIAWQTAAAIAVGATENRAGRTGVALRQRLCAAGVAANWR